MTHACRQLQVSISLRVAGALDAAEGARLDAHLGVCPACRAEVARTAELLDLVRLPPPTQAEHHALADLPARIVAELRSPRPTRAPASLRNGRRIALGALVAAGIGALVIAPGLIHREGPPPAASAEVAAASDGVAPEGSVTAQASPERAWEEPDLDALWQDASIVTLDGSEGG